MMVFVLNGATTMFTVLFVLAWAKRRFERHEERLRLEMERLVLEVKSMRALPASPPIPLEPGMTVEDPPVLVVQQPLPVARVVKDG